MSFCAQETFEEYDATEVAKTIVKGVREINLTSGRRQNYTLIHFIEVFRGNCIRRILISYPDNGNVNKWVIEIQKELKYFCNINL